jgi:GR25 family glycosyltransferase involved in LPS biosynthesis
MATITSHIYIISYNNKERLNKMLLRFKNIELPKPIVLKQVELNDIRFENIIMTEPRTWAIMLQHLDALTNFYLSEDSDDYCIICEDDVLLSNKLKNNLPNIVKQFFELNLDVLLLAYLTNNPYEIEPSNNMYYPHIEPHRFYGFPDDLWGSQMYMISKKHAGYLINKYTVKWASENPDKPYSPDWILTKIGNRALLYPPLGIEDGNTQNNNEEHSKFHRNCFIAQYKKGEFE